MLVNADEVKKQNEIDFLRESHLSEDIAPRSTTLPIATV